MTERTKDRTAPPQRRQPFCGPRPADHERGAYSGTDYGTELDTDADRETPIAAKVRLAREADAAGVYISDPATGAPDRRGLRLSPPVILVLIALAFGLVVVLLVFGGVL